MQETNLIEALSAEATTYPAKAADLRIYDRVSLDIANAFLRGIKALQAKIAESFDPQIKRAHEAHRGLIEEKKKHTEPLMKAEIIVKGEMGRYLSEQERIRKETEEKAKREAEEVERKRLAEMQKAVDAENEGKTEEAEKHFEEAIAIETPKPVIPPAVKVEGTHLRKELKWRVVDLAAVPSEYKMIDRAKVEMVFRAQRDKMAIPGIETYEETSVVSRS